ncbi:hypothetical protein TeGR_g80 [Tetraparma gracilis]|uniref:PDZ domain-containing protein n=1 Tax=Tetraparma gracilis TaxID=2962635 RepID=A0ABQ6MRY4_9STRA|nr:hypothetical protein TeGR_g80 [Tetraparma gracilis]
MQALLILLLLLPFSLSFLPPSLPPPFSVPSSLRASYSVTLPLPPLGIVFAERSLSNPSSGVAVSALTTGGAGERCGLIEPGDVLLSTSAVKFRSGSSSYDVVTVDCRSLDFDTIVSAIGSNKEKFRVEGVELEFERPDERPDEPPAAPPPPIPEEELKMPVSEAAYAALVTSAVLAERERGLGSPEAKKAWGEVAKAEEENNEANGVGNG